MTIDAVCNLAEAYFLLDRQHKALPLLNEFMKKLPEDHPDYLRMKDLKRHPRKPLKPGKRKK